MPRSDDQESYDEELDFSNQEEYSEEESENEDDFSDQSDSNEDPSGDEEDESQVESDEEDYKIQEKIAKMKRSLAHVSFDQLAEIKNKTLENGRDKKRTVSKEQIAKDVRGEIKKLVKEGRIQRTKKDMKRESKNSPMEVSSKRAVSRFRKVVEIQKPKIRDPRFEKLSGHFNQDLFEKSYQFLNDYKKSEMEMLRERIAKEKDPEELAKLKNLLTKMKAREATAAQVKRQKELLRERKKAEAELVKQGKKPYFLKKSEKRKLILTDKFKQLDEKSIDKILEKRRKRNATKDHRHVPFKRRKT